MDYVISKGSEVVVSDSEVFVNDGTVVINPNFAYKETKTHESWSEQTTGWSIGGEISIGASYKKVEAAASVNFEYSKTYTTGSKETTVTERNRSTSLTLQPG